jgi:hypothetical protein
VKLIAMHACFKGNTDLVDLTVSPYHLQVLTPNANDDVRRVVTTSKRSGFYTRCSTRLVKRRLSYEPAADVWEQQVEEEILHKHHQIFRCPEDHSLWTSLLDFCVIIR